MRYSVILILLTLTRIELQAQSSDLMGIYQVDWGYSYSFRYLILDCDSSYRFITHWDFGGKKDISPPINETKKWYLDKDNKVVLETEVYKYRTFEILSNKNLRHTKKHRDVMIRIGTIKSDCSISDFIYSFRPENYSIARFLPGLKITSLETIVDKELKQRTTYHTLSDQEYSDLIGAKSYYRNFPDKIMEVKFKIDLFEAVWPVEKIETWDNGELTIKYFDRFGQEIKKGE